jgi:hypothetical protein
VFRLPEWRVARMRDRLELSWRFRAPTVLAVGIVGAVLNCLAVNYLSAQPQQGGLPPDSGCPAYPAFPDASCTGWRHTGVTLRAVPSQVQNGPGWHFEIVAGQPYLYVTADGAVVDGLDISACVKVQANNVTIKRSRVRCADYYLIRTSDPPTHFTGLTLSDVELDGLSVASSQSVAVEEATGAHYIRLDVHGMAGSGPRIGSGSTIEESYIHDFVCAPPDHTAGISSNGGGSNILVRHNNIDISPAGGCATASWEIAKDGGTYNGVLTEKNLFNGGSYCAYAAIVDPGSRFAPATNVRFIDNVFGRKYTAQCGNFGPIAQYGAGPGNAWINNTWGPGAMATAKHKIGDVVIP